MKTSIVVLSDGASFARILESLIEKPDDDKFAYQIRIYR